MIKSGLYPSYGELFMKLQLYSVWSVDNFVWSIFSITVWNIWVVQYVMTEFVVNNWKVREDNSVNILAEWVVAIAKEIHEYC